MSFGDGYVGSGKDVLKIMRQQEKREKESKQLQVSFRSACLKTAKNKLRRGGVEHFSAWPAPASKSSKCPHKTRRARRSRS